MATPEETKASILAMLDELRQQAEAGELHALAFAAVRTDASEWRHSAYENALVRDSLCERLDECALHLQPGRTKQATADLGRGTICGPLPEAIAEFVRRVPDSHETAWATSSRKGAGDYPSLFFIAFGDEKVDAAASALGAAGLLCESDIGMSWRPEDEHAPLPSKVSLAIAGLRALSGSG